MHSAFKFICHRNAPVLSYSILSWDLLLMPAVLSSCDGVQTCPCKPRWTMGYPLVWHPPGKVVPPKGQNSHSQLLWLMQCGMVLNIASQLINHSCSQVTFPSSVLQLFPLASLCQSSSRQIKKKVPLLAFVCVYINMSTHICTFWCNGKACAIQRYCWSLSFFSPLCSDLILALLSFLPSWAWVALLGQPLRSTARGFNLVGSKASLFITPGESRILPVQYSNLSPGADEVDGELDPLNNWFTRYSQSLLHEATGGLWLIQKGKCFCITARYWAQIKAHGCSTVRTGPFFILCYVFKP